MSATEERNSLDFLTRKYWIVTLVLFVFSFFLFLLIDLAFSHWTHLFGTNTYSKSFRQSLMLSFVFAFLYPPVMRLTRKWIWKR
jgi:hypothetical protein